LRIDFFQLLQEEVEAQQTNYEQFIKRVHTILECSDPDSKDVARINVNIEEVNASWDRVHGRLAERETTLADMHDASTQFYETIEVLSTALQTLAEVSIPTSDSVTDSLLGEQRDRLNVSISFCKYKSLSANHCPLYSI